MRACIASKDLIETGSERVQLDLSTGDVCSEVLNVGGDRGAGARENRGREGYGRREKKGREAGSLRWREAGEKFKKSSFFFCYCLLPIKETNPTTFLDFHLTFSEA